MNDNIVEVFNLFQNNLNTEQELREVHTIFYFSNYFKSLIISN